METTPFTEGNPRLSLPNRFISANEIHRSAEADTWLDKETGETVSFAEAWARSERKDVQKVFIQ
ncbi:MAG: hypothetical protein PHO48_04050 [Candidatus Gracilibacteria bacterium]|nr:hypothetical protein [Candidatus Gracilibacteria bacterium]MDD5179480.1 hypothetical protein [Candidatus Gracilibacteria bacterium]